jgi:hypothetical protein
MQLTIVLLSSIVSLILSLLKPPPEKRLLADHMCMLGLLLKHV